tara:strand:+ start:42454 stop:42939 length:486 start_codon:yes stop_codon:yes gene_type:complete
MNPELLLKINGLVSKYEYPFLGLLISSILINQLTEFEFRGTLLIITCSILAVAYFFSAFGDVHNMPSIKKPGIDPKWHFLVPFSKKLVAISSAISCMGILFYSLQWPGAINQLIAGGSALMICIVIMLYLRHKNEDLIRQSLLIRAIALVTLLGYAGYFAS